MGVSVEEKQGNILPAQHAETVTVYPRKGYLAVKRMLDIVGAFLIGAALLIPLCIIGAVVRIDSGGPAIFRQKRMGKDGKVFTIYKFRTMSVSAPSDMAAQELLDADKYITKFGALLRRTSIDELPQLYNILMGDMSFVGYRPVCLTEEELNDLRRTNGAMTVRPGITGLAQVSGRDNLTRYQKAELDAQYARECSLKMDIRCILQTVKTVITGEGVN